MATSVRTWEDLPSGDWLETDESGTHWYLDHEGNHWYSDENGYSDRPLRTSGFR